MSDIPSGRSVCLSRLLDGGVSVDLCWTFRSICIPFYRCKKILDSFKAPFVLYVKKETRGLIVEGKYIDEVKEETHRRGRVHRRIIRTTIVHQVKTRKVIIVNGKKIEVIKIRPVCSTVQDPQVLWWRFLLCPQPTFPWRLSPFVLQVKIDSRIWSPCRGVSPREIFSRFSLIVNSHYKLRIWWDCIYWTLRYVFTNHIDSIILSTW